MKMEQENGNARNSSFAFIDIKELAVRANRAGIGSREDEAFFELVIRAKLGEIPGCVCRKNNGGADEMIVFDLRAPPDYLPERMRQECVIAADMIVERREQALAEYLSANQAEDSPRRNATPEQSMAMVCS